MGAPLALGRHEDIKVVEDFWMFGEPLETVDVGPHANLEPRVEIIYRVLVV